MEIKQQFVNFAFYQADPAWRRLAEEEKSRGKQAFVNVVEHYRKSVIINSYSLTGLRSDADFMPKSFA